jgi:hypothetical protein
VTGSVFKEGMMAADPTMMNPMEFGVVATSLILVWKLLDVAKQLFLANKVPSGPEQLSYDTLMRQRVKDIHNHCEGIQSDMDRGEFGCQWKDREEVRDYIDITKRQVTAMESMVREMGLLRQELVITRNGKS